MSPILCVQTPQARSNLELPQRRNLAAKPHYGRRHDEKEAAAQILGQDAPKGRPLPLRQLGVCQVGSVIHVQHEVDVKNPRPQRAHVRRILQPDAKEGFFALG